MMIILMGIALTILCICSVMELALLLLMLMKSSANPVLLKNKAKNDSTTQSAAEPAPVDAEDVMRMARKRYEEELIAFQDLLNYNADVAYGVDTLKSEE